MRLTVCSERESDNAGIPPRQCACRDSGHGHDADGERVNVDAATCNADTLTRSDSRNAPGGSPGVLRRCSRNALRVFVFP